MTLADAERFARELLWHTPEAAAFVFDAEAKLHYADGGALRRAGVDPGVLSGQRVADVLPEPMWEELKAYYGRVLAGERFASDVDLSNGRRYRFRGTPIVDDDGDVAGGLLVTHEAVTQAEERLEQRLRQQAAVAELGRLAVAGRPLSELTEKACALITEALDAVDGAAVVELMPEGDEVLVRSESSGRLTGERVPLAGSLPEAVLATHSPLAVSELTEDGPSFSQQFRDLGAQSGACVPIGAPNATFGMLGVFCSRPFHFGPEHIAFLESIANVLAEAARREEADLMLRRQALHDLVTGLPTRALLEDRLRQSLGFAERAGLRVAVLLIDLDRFKVVNNSLGHEGGDAVLRAVAERLRTTVRESDTVARFGGDEFVIVAAGLENEQEAVRIAETVLARLADPIVIGGQNVHVRASIGICLAGPLAHVDPHTIIRDADTAMHRAKVRGRARYEVADPDAARQIVDRLHLEQELRSALSGHDLQLVFQPFVRITDHATIGAEVLLRWRHPTHGFLRPAEFLDVAEQSGLIVPIGEWMLREACAHAVRWSRERSFLLTVNLSAGQLADSGIVAAVARALSESGLPAERLGLELTEHVLVGDELDALRTLSDLKRLGVKLLLDDFGTGFSSLSHLKRFPIDAVKIDRIFIEGLGAPGGDGDDAAIISAIVGMSRATGKRVIPEGIETEEQLRELRRLGCESGQGYLFSRPMTVPDFDKWIGRTPEGRFSG